MNRIMEANISILLKILQYNLLIENVNLNTSRMVAQRKFKFCLNNIERNNNKLYILHHRWRYLIKSVNLNWLLEVISPLYSQKANVPSLGFFFHVFFFYFIAKIQPKHFHPYCNLVYLLIIIMRNLVLSSKFMRKCKEF